MSASILTLASAERKDLIRLLGKLQSHLESAIESALLPGTDVAQHGYKRQAAIDGKDWRMAEAWVKRMEAGR